MKTISGEYLLKKFPGKGGWTYVVIPQVALNPDNPFGWVQVSGRIDNYELNRVKLMPMGDGQLFLPVKKLIRSKIKKEAGAMVHIELYEDNSPIEVPQEILDCLSIEDSAVQVRFHQLSNGKKKQYIDHIYSAKSESTKVNRIAQMIRDLAAN